MAMAFDFSTVTAPFRMQPGLRRIPPGMPQLTPASTSSRHFREKSAVLAAFTGEALCALPGFDAMPLYQAIADESARTGGKCGSAFEVDASSAQNPVFHAPRIGWSISAGGVAGDGDSATGELLRALPAAHRPAALLCLAFEEDFAALEGDGAVPWLAVALPSRWAPAEKLGRHFAAVHAPVADNAQLLASADALTRIVTSPGDRWERFVWTITPEPRLHQHPARGTLEWQGTCAADVAANAYFRSERQTFVPVAGARRAVFTIHVESAPLAQAVGSAEAAGRVRDALASMSAAVLAYRGLAGVREPLLAWLGSRALLA